MVLSDFVFMLFSCFFFFKQKTAYEMRISDWSSDVCSSDLLIGDVGGVVAVDQTLNLALVMDVSDSMEDEITFNGVTMSWIEALDLSTERPLDKMAGTAGATVRVHMVSFAYEVERTDTFDIITAGGGTYDELQSATEFTRDDTEDTTD